MIMIFTYSRWENDSFSHRLSYAHTEYAVINIISCALLLVSVNWTNKLYFRQDRLICYNANDNI